MIWFANIIALYLFGNAISEIYKIYHPGQLYYFNQHFVSETRNWGDFILYVFFRWAELISYTGVFIASVFFTIKAYS